MNVAIDVGKGLSEISRLAILSGVDGISRHKEIATATRINPSGKWIPRGFVRRENMRRRDISRLILLRFNILQKIGAFAAESNRRKPLALTKARAHQRLCQSLIPIAVKES